MSLSRSAVGVLLATLLALPVGAQGTAFKHALPESCILFVTAPDFYSSIQEFKSTAFFLMWKEDEVQEFLAEILKEGAKKKEELLAQGRAMHKAGQFPVDPDDLLKLRLRNVTMAATSLELKMSEFGRPDPRIGVLIHADFGDSMPSWHKIIQLGMDRLEEKAGEKLSKTATKIEGVELVTMSNPRSSMSLNVAFVGTGVVIGTIKDEVETAIRNYITGKAVLTATTTYKETVKRLDTQGAEVELYFQPKLLVDNVMKMVRAAAKRPGIPRNIDVDGIDRAVTAFGLRSCNAVGVTSQYQGKKSLTRGFVNSPEPQRQGIAVSGGKALQLDFLKWVPKDAATLSAGTFNAMALHDALVNAVKAYDKEQAEQLMAALKSYEEQFGMTLKEDLFGVLGDHYIWWSMGMSSFLQAPEGALLVKIKDEARLLKMLETLTNLSEGSVELIPTERRGVKTYRLEINPEMLPNEGVAMALSVVQPCFAFKNGYVVAALSTGDVRRAMKRMEREDDPKSDIRGNDAFAEYVDMIPKKNLNGIGWTDWRNSFENMYQAVTSVLALSMPGDNVPIDLTLLPEAETLSKHLCGAMSWSVVDATGYSTTMISPMGPEIIVGGAGLAAAFAGFMTVTRGGMVAARPARRPVVVRKVPMKAKAKPKAGLEDVTEEEAESKPTKKEAPKNDEPKKEASGKEASNGKAPTKEEPDKVENKQ
jgi:hypothetical protein